MNASKSLIAAPLFNTGVNNNSNRSLNIYKLNAKAKNTVNISLGNTEEKEKSYNLFIISIFDRCFGINWFKY